MVGITEVELDFVSVEVDGNGFLRISLSENVNVEIGLHEAKQIVDRILSICEENPKPLLIDARNVFGSVSPDAREYLASNKQLKASILGQAYIFNSLANRLLAAFYMNFNKSTSPIKIFDGIDLASTWLSGFQTK